MPDTKNHVLVNPWNLTNTRTSNARPYGINLINTAKK